MHPAQEVPPFAYDPVQQVLVLIALAQPDGSCPVVHLRDLQRRGWHGDHEDYAKLPRWPLGSEPPAIHLAPDMGAARTLARDLRRIRR
jgi:hypothetical protein